MMYRSIGTLISRSSKGSSRLSRTFFAHSLSSPTPFLSSPVLHSSRLLSPLSKLINPSQGPLFLSFPPWKLSQSATPLYFQSDLVLLPKVPALDFLQRRNLPINFKSVSSVPTLLDRTVVKESSSDGQAGGLAESFLNLPNLISISRMVSGPFLGWMIIHEMYLPAFVGLAISGATDWLDGYVARKMGINSVVGSYLDPLADKVLIGCVAVAMVDNGLLHPGLVGLVLLRDVGLVGGAVYKRASSLDWQWKSWFDFFNIDGTHAEKVEPLYISKVNTVFQLVLVAAALLQPEFGNSDTQIYVTYLSWLVASTTVASTAAYGAQYLKNRSGLIKSHR